jgi:DNA-binding CsgD family transcriptional regulator
MELDKRAGGQLAPCAELASLTESGDPIGSHLRSPPPMIPAGLAVVRALREARVTAENRKTRIASALNNLPVPSAQLLQEYFDLTSAEVRLAQSLARGLSLEEAARHLNIKMSTARTQLAAIFAKTDTQRQGKLIAMLSRIAHID